MQKYLFAIVLKKLSIAIWPLIVSNCNNVKLILMVALVHTKVLVPYRRWLLPQGIQKFTIGVVLKMLSIAVVQRKVNNYNSARKSCLSQVVHTKAIDFRIL